MIYHITSRKRWKQAWEDNLYRTESLEKEGFIHCSTLEKIGESAATFFKGQTDLVVLCIDEKKVKSKIVWEDLYKKNFEFPHIYGELNIDSVTEVFELISDV